MKQLKVFSVVMAAAIIVGLVAGCAAPASTAKTFVIATDASWPPMESVDENKNIVGFDIDLITAIAKDQKFAVRDQEHRMGRHLCRPRRGRVRRHPVIRDHHRRAQEDLRLLRAVFQCRAGSRGAGG